MRLLIAIFSLQVLVASAVAQISEPEIVTKTKHKVIDSVTYEVDLGAGEGSPEAVSLFRDKASECAVRNLSFDAFQGRDSSGSFVGAYTGRYYQTDKRTFDPGSGELIVFASETKPLVVARGRETIGGAFPRMVQFNVAIDGEGKLVFENINMALLNTGSAKNTGFGQVYKQWGTGHKVMTKKLTEVAETLAECMNRS